MNTMQLKFELNKDELWAAGQDICCAAIYLNKQKSLSVLYHISWGLFWLSVMVSLTVMFGDENIQIKNYISELFLGSAFLAFFFFNKFAINLSPKRFNGLVKGNEGNHELNLGEREVIFTTPSGNIQIDYSMVVDLIAINKHLLIFTAFWSCYIPLEKFGKDELNEVSSMLQNKTSLTLINRL